MARILVGTVPARGHVDPLIAVAQRLVERRHEVAWITHTKFREVIESVGATFVPPTHSCRFSDGEFENALPNRPKGSGLRQLKFDLKHVFIDDAVGQLEDMRTFAASFQPSLVLADAAFMGAHLYAELSGTPHCAMGVIPMTLGGDEVAPFGLGLPPNASWWGRQRNRALHALVRRVLFADVQRYNNLMRVSAGLEPSSHWVLDGPVHCTLYLQPTIPQFEYSRRAMPNSVHFIGALPVARPADWSEPAWWPELDGSRPVVHITQGTFANDQPRLIAPALEGLADEDVLVVVSTGGQSLHALGLESLPTHARAATFLSYPDLLPRTSVMLTNGGYGGVQAALSHGVPVIVAGRTEDKAEVAARVAWSGAGLDLKTSTPSPRAIRLAVRRVLNEPKFRNRAQMLARDYARHDAIGQAVELLEHVAKAQ